jgi:LysR family transcriptional regulator for metE and metH
VIEIRHLRSLIAIAETRRIAGAAERVHLTQSALSHQVRALEEHYGIRLFERARDGVRFTQAGEKLLAAARDVLGRIAEAEREVARLKGDTRGELRIALECHTCFDWLMPVMDEFRRRWPEVEVDLVAGFHPNPIELLGSGKADLVIGSRPLKARQYFVAPLFRFEIVLVIALEHRLRAKRFIDVKELVGETLITYPVPPQRIDLIREALEPAGLKLQRRTAELTVAIVQLVASRRGIAALPNWGVKSYVEHDYVLAKRIGRTGLWSELHAIVKRGDENRPYLADLVKIVRDICAAGLDRIELL